MSQGYFGLIKSIKAGKEIHAELMQKTNAMRKSHHAMHQVATKIKRDIEDTQRFLNKFERDNPELVNEWWRNKKGGFT